jgi:prefoldin beta subunit
MEVGKEAQQKIQQLQILEQNLQAFLLQRQQLQTQLIEIESALKELKDTKEAYKIIGNIMVSSKKEDLEKDLTQKKETAELRIKTLEKQEKTIKERAKKLQQEVLSSMKNDKDEGSSADN